MNRQWSHRVVLLSCGCMVIWLMMLAAQAGYASLHYFQAAFALDRWQRSTPAEAEFSLAQAAIARAVTLQPANPHYLLTQAKIAEWGWHSGYLSTTMLAQNEALYLRAIRLRPDWPVAYADYGYFLGHSQFRLTDAWRQLMLARQYGAFLPQVQQKFLSFAFQYWRYMSPPQKAEILGYVQQTFFSQLQGQTLVLIRQYQMQRQLCIYLSRRALAEPGWPQVRPQICGVAGPDG